MLPRVDSVCSYPSPYKGHGCEHYMYYTPSIGMLSSDPLGMPDAEGVGRAVPPSGGVSLLPPNACGGDDWPREGGWRRISHGSYSSVNRGLEKAFCGGVSGSYCSLELFATFATTLGGASSSCAVIADQQT